MSPQETEALLVLRGEHPTLKIMALTYAMLPGYLKERIYWTGIQSETHQYYGKGPNPLQAVINALDSR